MAEKIYKPIGGVVAAELFPAGGLHSMQEAVAGEGVSVELVDDSSSYEELFSVKEGLVSVQHTLTLCAARNKAAVWLDADFMQRCAVEGVVARVEMATGEVLWIGWSKKFQFEQALRLKQLQFLSGKELNFPPRITLTLTSCDVQSAIV